jgi:hypothetical protein
MFYLGGQLARCPMDWVHLQIECALQDPDHVRVLKSHQSHPILGTNHMYNRP